MGVDPRAHHVLHGNGVCLRLIQTAVAREVRSASNLDGRTRKFAVTDPRERAAERHREVGFGPLGHLLDRMAQHHVPDLVAQRARELVELTGVVDQPAIHVDEAAGQREGVHVLAVHDEEFPVEVRA